MPFSSKMRNSYSKSCKIEYTPIIMIFSIVLIVHKYEESNIDLKLFLNCCILGNCVILLARPFHTCIPLTVIDSSLWVVFVFLT